MFSIVHQSENSERRGGIVLKDGRYESIKDCKIETEYDEDNFQKPLQLGQRQMMMNMKSKVVFYRSFHSEIEELHLMVKVL